MEPLPVGVAVVPSTPLRTGLAGLDTTFRSQPAQIQVQKLVPGIAQRGVPAVTANAAKVGRAEGDDRVADSVAGQYRR